MYKARNLDQSPKDTLWEDHERMSRYHYQLKQMLNNSEHELQWKRRNAIQNELNQVGAWLRKHDRKLIIQFAGEMPKNLHLAAPHDITHIPKSFKPI